MGSAIEVYAGSDKSQGIQLYAGGRPFTDCAAGDTFAVTLWGGGDLAPISPSPSCSWIDPTQGTCLLYFSRALTAILAPGDYTVLVKVVRTASAGGQVDDGFRGTLRVLAVAGTAAAGPTFCTAADLAEYYPEVWRSLGLASDESGFLKERRQARAEMIGFWVDRYEPQVGFSKRRQAVADPNCGYDVPSRAGIPADRLPTKAELRAALLRGGLVLDEIDGLRVAKVAAGMALALILERNEIASRAQNAYAQSANEFRARAKAELAEFRPYVDMSNPLDGTEDIQLDKDQAILLDGWQG